MGRPTISYDKAAELYQQGHSVKWIAAQMHVNEMTIYRALKIKNVKLHYKGGHPHKCRNGHPRFIWGHKNVDGRWRCRKCEGRDIPLQVVIQVRDTDVRREKVLGLFSTVELAKRGRWDVEEWVWDEEQGIWLGDVTLTSWIEIREMKVDE